MVEYINPFKCALAVKFPDGTVEEIEPDGVRHGPRYEMFVGRHGLRRRVRGKMIPPAMDTQPNPTFALPPLQSFVDHSCEQPITPSVIEQLRRERRPLLVRYTGTIGDAVEASSAVSMFHSLYPEIPLKIQVLNPYKPLVSCFRNIPPYQDWDILPDGSEYYIYLGYPPLRGVPREGIGWGDGYAEALGFPEMPPPLGVNVPQEAKNAVANIVSSPFIVFHFFSLHSISKTYPVELASRVCELLRSVFPQVRVVVVGGADEPAITSIDGVLNVSGDLTLVETLALLSESRVIIAIDSWLWHISRVLRKPCVALFGSTRPMGHPKWWDKVVIIRGETCVGKDFCSMYRCTSNHCISSLSPERVVSTVGTVLRQEGNW